MKVRQRLTKPSTFAHEAAISSLLYFLKNTLKMHFTTLNPHLGQAGRKNDIKS
jgi:hypothetical protein